MALPGLATRKIGTTIAPRTIELDPWAAHAFTNYLSVGRGGSATSLLYGGYQSADSFSAQVTTQAHLKNTATRAGLPVGTVTPDSVRLWAAIRDTTDGESFLEAARRYGTSWHTLLRRLEGFNTHRMQA